MPADTRDLASLFRSTEELEEPELGTVQGEIPTWINGTLFRTGPALFDLGEGYTLNHWLDGYALLSKFEIRNSAVKFHKKFLKSDALIKAKAAGKPIFTEFGTRGSPDPSKNVFSRFISSVFPVDMTDNDCVSIFTVGKDLFTISDTCFMRKINRDLETCEKVDTNKCFGSVMNGTSAHPVREEDGTVYNIGFSCISGLKFNVLKITGKGGCTSKEIMKNSKVIASVNSRWSTGIAYNHSFGVTENYIILIEQPYVVSFSRLAGSVLKGGGSFKEWLEWRGESEKNRFVIIEKTGKVIKTEYFSNEAFFFLHFINCYEENNEITIDLNVYKSPKFLDSMYLNKLRNNIIEEVDPPCAQRFIVPLVDIKQTEDGVNLVKTGGTTATAIKTGGTIYLTPEILTERGLELPAINQNFLGKKYTRFYAAGTVCDNTFVNSVCKVNIDTKETFFWRGSRHQYPGEPVFIRNPNGDSLSDEEDGVVISPITDVSDENDFLVFIDAKTWKEIGRASFSSHVAQALHGIYLEDSK